MDSHENSTDVSLSVIATRTREANTKGPQRDDKSALRSRLLKMILENEKNRKAQAPYTQTSK